MPNIEDINGVAAASVGAFSGVSASNIAKVDGVDLVTFTGLLDTYTGAAAAYSTRKLKSGITVAARIRRSGDDIEADVEFDSNNEISLTSPISNASSGTYTDLADFVDHSTTPRDAFCVEWKDQSGNGNDATQPTAGGSGQQPKLYDATTGLVTEGTNSKPALSFDKTRNDSLDLFSIPSYNSNDAGFFLVCRSSSSPTSFTMGLFTGTGAGGGTTHVGLGYRTSTILHSGTTLGSVSTNTNHNLFSLYADNASSDVKGYVNGSLLGSTTPVSNTPTLITIGLLGNITGTGWDGTIQEAIIYGSSTKSDHTAIELNISTHFGT